MEKALSSSIEHNNEKVVNLSFIIPETYRLALSNLIKQGVECPLKNHEKIPYLTGRNIKEIWNNVISKRYNSFFTNNLNTNLDLSRLNKDQIEWILSYLIIFCAKYHKPEPTLGKTNYNISLTLPQMWKIHNSIRKKIASCFGEPEGTYKMKEKLKDIIKKKSDDMGLTIDNIEYYLAWFLNGGSKNGLKFNINDIEDEEKRENFLCDFYSMFALKTLFHDINHDT